MGEPRKKPRKFRCENVTTKKVVGAWWTNNRNNITTSPRQCVYEAGHKGDCNFATAPLIKPPMRNPYPTWFEETK